MASNQAVYTDATRSPSDRADDLLSQMTLQEKVAQLGSYWVYQLFDNMDFSIERARSLLQHGIGQITRLGGASNRQPAELAELANTIQKFLIEETRLGIPAVIHEECCSGYMARGATVFPQAIGVASTWEPELVKAMTDVIRAQMRSVGTHHALAPVLDITRDARWGRLEETFGEDPYLVAQMGVAYITGLQGSDLKNGIVATGKHFVGYGMTEGGMNWSPAHFGERELRETYLFPFEAAVREAKLASMMNAYHELDGIPCAISRKLLIDILRDEWGFEGTVVSDYFAINMLIEYHHIARDKIEATRMALEAGIDVELPSTDCFGDAFRQAIEKGDMREDLVDQALRRVLTQKFALGVFESPYVDVGKVAFDTADQRKLAHEIAQKSIILLKNTDHLLPLAKDTASIAVIGPNADQVRNLFGDYAYPAHIESLMEMRDSNNVFDMPIPDDFEAVDDFIPVISVLQAIREKASSQSQVTYAQGCDVMSDSTEGFAEAVAVAQKADVALLIVGDKGGITVDCTSGEARDRAEIGLPGVQEALVKAVVETGTPVVLVLVNGRPVTLEWMAEDIPAIVEAWFPSEEGGNAIADVLFGDVNPGGKLPISFPRAVGQIPVYYGHKPSGGRSHWMGDYVSTSTKPQYPFGHGLSYTEFAFDNLRIEQAEVKAGESVTIRADVRNVGGCAGDEVVQLYIHKGSTSVTRPVKQLMGFKRLTLQPGETQMVTFELAANQLALYNQTMDYVLEPGPVEVMIGSSSEDIHLTGAFEVVGDTVAVQDKVFFSTVELS